MRQGTVLWYSTRDKNDIIIDSDKNEYYFDISVVQNRDDTNLKRKCVVEFVLNSDIKTPLCAKEVRIK